jgi:hypothetical protein
MQLLRWIEYVARMGGEEVRLQNFSVGIRWEVSLRIKQNDREDNIKMGRSDVNDSKGGEFSLQ